MEVKIPASHEWPKIEDFLQKNLRSEVSWSYAHEYPLAFSERNMGNLRFIENEEKVLAHAVMKPHLVRTGYHLLKVGLIGSVVTDESHRGQGYSSEVIKSCLEACEQQQCDIAVLWTNLFDFYAKLGFEVAGQEVALEIGPNFKGELKEHLRYITGTQISPDALLRVYNQHSLRTLRMPREVQAYLQIPQTEIHTAWNQQTNALEAYVVIGKGADFANYIHEWGGHVSSLISLLTHIHQKRQGNMTLITPPQCGNFIRQLESRGAEKFVGVLGMMQITHPQNFCRKIKRGARALGFDQLIFDYREGSYYFGYGDDIYQTDSSQDIVRLVFGPMKAGRIHTFAPETTEIMEQIFPIPFWIWGWDSI